MVVVYFGALSLTVFFAVVLWLASSRVVDLKVVVNRRKLVGAENPDELASGLVQSERERLCTVRAHCDRSLSDLDRLELGRSGRGGLSEE